MTILLVMFLIFLGIRYFFLDLSKREGRIRIISSPTASIFINNKAVGRSTPFEEKINPGEYLVKLIPEGEATSTASWQDKIKVYSKSVTYIERDLGFSEITSSGVILYSTPIKSIAKKKNYGEIYVESDPAGVIIKLDNDEKGFAPMLIIDVLKGTHELTAMLPGFFSKSIKINVDSGYRVTASFKLAVDQSQKTDKKKESTKSAEIQTTEEGLKVEISDTETGYLRVRKDPSLYSEELFRVNPGDIFKVLEEKNGWYKIEYEKDKQGWISSQYAKKKE
jgi:hypothetical protein